MPRKKKTPVELDAIVDATAYHLPQAEPGTPTQWHSWAEDNPAPFESGCPTFKEEFKWSGRVAPRLVWKSYTELNEGTAYIANAINPLAPTSTWCWNPALVYPGACPSREYKEARGATIAVVKGYLNEARDDDGAAIWSGEGVKSAVWRISLVAEGDCFDYDLHHAEWDSYKGLDEAQRAGEGMAWAWQYSRTQVAKEALAGSRRQAHDLGSKLRACSRFATHLQDLIRTAGARLGAAQKGDARKYFDGDLPTDLT